VLSAVLAKRGVKRIVATDQDPRALACARENLTRLGYDSQVELIAADLFPEGRAPLVVCNPPWVPARPSSPIEHAVYDPDSRMLRGFLGGLARATAEVALLLDAAGKKQVLIETVGVGQDEIDIVRLADCVIVMLVPGLGDDIQNMKAGLMEIGDIFVLNKADREGADRLEQQLLAMLSLVMPRDGWHPPVVRTVATENKGVEALAETVAKFRMHFEASGERQRKQVEHWKNRLLELLGSRLLERALGGAGGEATLAALAGEVADRKKDPFTAVNEILKSSGLAS